MFKSVICAVALLVATSVSANADCPSKAPSFKAGFAKGDKKVNAAWLNKTLPGHRVVFDGGTEHYKADGSYSYSSGNQRWDAPSVKFYANGLRCIGYPSPRFDLYVVNDRKLVLFNSGGERYVGKILK